ncbi:MAG: hypothetical protein QOF91_1127 [Alphaproteobacteria bacterium]|jgi:hypothetical protein|nr:hypothetical protein [Alphaproteobacteria bacterium]
MKAAVFATGLAPLSLANPAYASWAENANMGYPVYTGTNAALARASYGARVYSARRFHHGWRRHYYR